MKYFILLFFLFVSSAMVSQNYTEKYNDLQQRYEYFGSDGRMVGYKKYNSLSEQWEYTDLTSSNNSQSNRYIVRDYGQVKSNFNTDLAIQALSYKQARYDNAMNEKQRGYNHNAQLIQTKMDNLYENLSKYSEEFRRDEARQRFYDWTQAFFKRYPNIDFSDSALANKVISLMTEEHNKIIREVNEMNRPSGYFTTFTSLSITRPLREQPSMSSKVIYECPIDSRVYVSNTDDHNFYKVAVDGYEGYISKNLLNEK